MGASALQAGLTSGLTGIVSQPLQGAQRAGAAGFVVGIGQGIGGLLPKVMSGVAGFASKASEGMSAGAKQYTPGARQAAKHIGRAGKLRVRQPRLLQDGVLRPYPRSPPIITLEDEPTSEYSEV